MLSEKEQEVLKAIGKKNLITMHDLRKIIGDGMQHTANNLIEKKLISEVRPIGTTCYVITGKGNKALHDIE